MTCPKTCLNRLADTCVIHRPPERGRDGLRDAIEALVDQWECIGSNSIGGSRVIAEHVADLRRILAEHPATGDEHHPKCYQRTGVPDDLPAGLCDCRVLRMLDAATPPASDVDSDNAAAGGAEGLADSVYRTGLVNLPLADSLDVDCHDVARAVLASDWLAAHDAKARADERERIAQAIQRAKPPHLTRDYTPVDAAYDTAARIARGES